MRACVANLWGVEVKNSFLVAVALSLLVSVVVFAASPSVAYALTCNRVSPQEELARSDAVFAGWVVSINHSSEPSALGPVEMRIVRFDVTRVWKGDVNERLVVKNEVDESQAADGYPFYEGEEYLVYAYGSGGDRGYRASYCSRTRPLSDAAEDLLALGKWEAPQWEDWRDGSGISDALRRRAGFVAVVVVSVVAVGGMVMAKRRRGRRGA